MMVEISTHVAFQMLFQRASIIMNGRMGDFVPDLN